VKKLIFGLLILIVTSGVTGCALRQPADPSMTSLVYGHVDMSEAPGKADMDTIKLMRAATQQKPVMLKGKVDYNGGISASRRPGNFWVYNLMPGSYQIAEIVGMPTGFSMGGPTMYHLSFAQSQKNASAMRIDEPGLHYMGSFKVVASEKSKFEMVRVDYPSEMEVLEKILKRNSMSYWEPIIKQRLAELRK